MRIIILGASGGVGKILTQKALEAGYKTTALVRSPEKLETFSARLNVVKGDVLEYDSVYTALHEQDIVLWTIGGHDTVRAPKEQAPKPLCRLGTLNVINAMKARSISRFIGLSSWGVGESMHRVPLVFRYVIFPLILKHELNDKEEQEKLVKASGLDYTIIRPSRLTNVHKNKPLRVAETLTYQMGNSISREAVANFMLQQTTDHSYWHETIEISY
jgi:putative NADH-flavin reductase